MLRTIVIAALLAGATPGLAQDATPLPGGATELLERHGSWQVSCGLVEGQKDCGFSQTASNAQTGTALVAIDLGAPSGNKAEGMLLTAFGLRLDAGVQLAIDGNKLGETLPFLTCIQTGCLVPLSFDEVSLSALKVGTTLEVTGIPVDQAEPVTVGISLGGFTAAYNRTAELSQ